MSVNLKAYWVFKIIAMLIAVGSMLCLFQVSVYAAIGVVLWTIFQAFDELGDSCYKDYLIEKRIDTTNGGIEK